MTSDQSSQLSSSGDFYDGSSPIPYNTNVSLKSDGLYLTFPSLDQKVSSIPTYFPFSKVRSVHSVGNKLRIELLNDLHPKARFLLTLDNTGIKPDLEKLWAQERKSLFLKLTLNLRNYSLTKKLIIALILVPAFVILFLSISYQTYRLIPISWEIKLGDMVTKQMIKDMPTCDSQELNNLLHQTASTLKDPDSPYSYEITVVKDYRVNAYAAPGKRIVLFSGLIENSDSFEEVAGVLAHEMSHIEKQHGLQNMVRHFGLSYLFKMLMGGMDMPDTFSSIVMETAILNYSREFEREADILAVQKLHRQHITVKPFIAFFKKLSEKRNKLYHTSEGKGNNKNKKSKQPESKGDNGDDTLYTWMSTHPSDTERVKYLTDSYKRERFNKKKMLMSKARWDKLKMACEAAKPKKPKLYLPTKK